MEAGKGAAPIGPGLQGNRILFQDLGWDGGKPIEGQAPRLGGGALGGREVGGRFREGLVSAAYGSPPLRVGQGGLHPSWSSCCLSPFPGIPSCPVCLVCSFLECVSVCLSVSLMTASRLLWKKATSMFSDSVCVSQSVYSWILGRIAS